MAYKHCSPTMNASSHSSAYESLLKFRRNPLTPSWGWKQAASRQQAVSNAPPGVRAEGNKLRFSPIFRVTLTVSPIVDKHFISQSWVRTPCTLECIGGIFCSYHLGRSCSARALECCYPLTRQHGPKILQSKTWTFRTLWKIQIL
jgi:hypothetical protein